MVFFTSGFWVCGLEGKNSRFYLKYKEFSFFRPGALYCDCSHRRRCDDTFCLFRDPRSFIWAASTVTGTQADNCTESCCWLCRFDGAQAPNLVPLAAKLGCLLGRFSSFGQCWSVPPSPLLSQHTAAAAQSKHFHRQTMMMTTMKTLLLRRKTVVNPNQTVSVM
ncbi:fibroblast growth factor receptor 1 isoform X4 [Protopterus annectens]|uniref:fibroblast growth factor receptor 1 isoform X4 n=1 Tax=Protopterus annectens TaxID=7888 RepID=UPI001CFA2DEE|nr:fibroblast growth factor receptor 1 isoform X4 [Protopterus annectens]